MRFVQYMIKYKDNHTAQGGVEMAEKPAWEGKRYSFFCNRECEYFPCHPTEDPDNFNCLFCYCPLYALGDRCGGAFTYNAQGYKDCTRCIIPHRRENYGRIIGRYPEIVELAKKNKE